MQRLLCCKYLFHKRFLKFLNVFELYFEVFGFVG